MEHSEKLPLIGTPPSINNKTSYFTPKEYIKNKKKYHLENCLTEATHKNDSFSLENDRILWILTHERKKHKELKEVSTLQTFISKNFNPDLPERLKTFEKFAFNNVERDEHKFIKSILTELRSFKEPNGTMLITDLWSKNLQKECLEKSNMFKEKKMLEKYLFYKNKKEKNNGIKEPKKFDYKTEIKIKANTNNELKKTRKDLSLFSSLNNVKEYKKSEYKLQNESEFVEKFKILFSDLDTFVTENNKDKKKYKNSFPLDEDEKEKNKKLPKKIR